MKCWCFYDQKSVVCLIVSSFYAVAEPSCILHLDTHWGLLACHWVLPKSLVVTGMQYLSSGDYLQSGCRILESSRNMKYKRHKDIILENTAYKEISKTSLRSWWLQYNSCLNIKNSLNIFNKSTLSNHSFQLHWSQHNIRCLPCGSLCYKWRLLLTSDDLWMPNPRDHTATLSPIVFLLENHF